MARLDFSPAVAGYLETHAVDIELAYELGIRSRGERIVYPVDPPLGDPYERIRNLNDEKKRTMQPPGKELVLWWPAGRPAPGAEVLVAEGEPDALAALSALNGRATAVAALPGTEVPPERITAELAPAARVILAMDGDAAGKKAADRIARALQTFTELYVLRVGDGEDLASRLYRENDREAWLSTALDEAVPAPKLKLKGEQSGYRHKAADQTRDLLARGIDPDKIELGGLLDDVVDFIRSYVVLPVVYRRDEAYEDVVAHVLALWVVHTHCFAACWATPYLRVVSAAPISAKSLLLEVLASISRRGWLAVNPSPAVLYRKIDRDTPTLFLDELDNFALDEKRDALAVLNSGYKPGAKVPRCNERGELEEFGCFCAKGYAGLDEKQLVPTLLSRSITIRMETKRASDHVEMWVAPWAGPLAEELRAKCAAWAERHVDELKAYRPDLVGLINRQAEVWWILLSLGELAGDEWTDRARTAARILGAGGDETDRPSRQVQLLMDINAAFGGNTETFTVDLLKHLNALDESPWGDRHRGDGINARDLSAMLRPFRIRPRTVRVGDETAKGYRVNQFEDVFARHLAPLPESVTSVTPVTTAPPSQADVTDVTDVTATEGGPFDDIDPDPTASAPPSE